MIRGTTPDFILNIPIDLSGQTIYVTVKDRRTSVTKSNDELTIQTTASQSTIQMWLTQEETLKFKEGSADIQVRFINDGGIAKATGCKPVNIEKVLLERVIEYVPDN